MTAEEIMHALRLTAMGRINTPEQQRLCEALAAVFASQALNTSDVVSQKAPEMTHNETPKRTRKKAD